MADRLVISGNGYADLANELRLALAQAQPGAIGVASAFVSTQGVDILAGMIPKKKGVDVRLVAGTSLAFTHPQALSEATTRKWGVRLGSCAKGIFHPKVVVAGRSFAKDGTVVDPVIVYIGSANLTAPGLTVNTECGAMLEDNLPPSAATVFRELWKRATPLSAALLQEYSAAFTRRNRFRSSRDLEDLGVADIGDAGEDLTSESIMTRDRPKHSALRHEDADTVWVGLESSTGAYTFQPEFPRVVGEMVMRILKEKGVKASADGTGEKRKIVSKINVLCADNVVREMTFTYYSHNAMSRLNVPNEVPNAEWARKQHKGVAVVERCDRPDAAISLEILRPSREANEIVRRSFVLGTWASTTTRAYGWY